MTTLYPVGYGTARVTLEEMYQRYSTNMEPEYARRLFAWIHSQNGKFGIGGAWRPTPSPVSYASRMGWSFHQTQTFNDGWQGFMAVDLVVYVGNGQVHRAPYYNEAIWQGSAMAQRIGLHMNISSETWHMQAIEIDGFASWKSAGSHHPAANYPISTTPIVPPPPPPVDPGWPVFDPEHGLYSLYPFATNKPTCKVGMAGQPHDAVRYLQGVMYNACGLRTIQVDGYYGNQTKAAVMQVQSWNLLTQDGVCGPQTWAVIDIYAKR